MDFGYEQPKKPAPRREPKDVRLFTTLVLSEGNETLVLKGQGRAVQIEYKDHTKWQIHMEVENEGTSS